MERNYSVLRHGVAAVKCLSASDLIGDGELSVLDIDAALRNNL